MSRVFTNKVNKQRPPQGIKKSCELKIIQPPKRLAYESNINIICLLYYIKISKLESVNEIAIEVSCSHLELNIIFLKSQWLPSCF